MCAEEAQEAAAIIAQQAMQCGNQHPGFWNPKSLPGKQAVGDRQLAPIQQQTCWVCEVADNSDAHADKDNHRSLAAKPLMLCQDKVNSSCLSQTNEADMTLLWAHASPLTALPSQYQQASACARLCAGQQPARPQNWASGTLCSAAEPMSHHLPSLQQCTVIFWVQHWWLCPRGMHEGATIR